MEVETLQILVWVCGKDAPIPWSREAMMDGHSQLHARVDERGDPTVGDSGAITISIQVTANLPLVVSCD